MIKRKGIWVATSKTLEELDRSMNDLIKMGVDELYLLVKNSGGTLYPSKVCPQPKELKGKDLVTPVIKKARSLGLKVHAWIVSLNNSNEEFIEKHKDWYVVNKLGERCTEKPPYVPHYKWLCPSRPEVKEFLADLFLEVAGNFDVDGVHFDYIRLPDIILPAGIRPRYPGVPKEEVFKPQYDFCYCENCRRLFEEEYGVDPIKLEYSDPLYGVWFKWRTERITEVVKYVYSKVKKYDPSLEVSAAVFATPNLAYKYVFQDWPTWGIDLYNPMIYHKYYEQDVEWIGTAVREGVIRGVKVSAGILLGFMETKEQLSRAIEVADENGAVGVTLFVYPPPRPELIEWTHEVLKKY